MGAMRDRWGLKRPPLFKVGNDRKSLRTTDLMTCVRLCRWHAGLYQLEMQHTLFQSHSHKLVDTRRASLLRMLLIGGHKGFLGDLLCIYLVVSKQIKALHIKRRDPASTLLLGPWGTESLSGLESDNAPLWQLLLSENCQK